jgi:hypothetical protein
LVDGGVAGALVVAGVPLSVPAWLQPDRTVVAARPNSTITNDNILFMVVVTLTKTRESTSTIFRQPETLLHFDVGYG